MGKYNNQKSVWQGFFAGIFQLPGWSDFSILGSSPYPPKLHFGLDNYGVVN